jgi:hypothetical protein
MKNRSQAANRNETSTFAERGKAKLCLDYNTVFRDDIAIQGTKESQGFQLIRNFKTRRSWNSGFAPVVFGEVEEFFHFFFISKASFTDGGV